MQVEPIGLLTIALGFLGWIAGPTFAAYVFFSSTLLSAAAAILLTSLGQANIQPAHLLLGFLALAALVRRDTVRLVGRSLAFPNEGFWLLLTAIYAALSAIFLPRILAGTTYVFAIARSITATEIVAIPLEPTSGNITQTVYFIGDVVCFYLFYTYACKPGGIAALMRAALVCTALDLVFATIDLVTYWGGLGDWLSVIRTADYSMLNEGTVLGFKRIVGSFPEASAFAYFTVGFFAFCTRLWLSGIYKRLTGPLALATFVTLIFATSSTGYAAICGFLGALFVVSLVQVLSGPVAPRRLIFAMVAPVVLCAGLIGLRLDHSAWAVVQQMVNQSVLDKLASSSGVERTMWNDQALTNFVETHGLGGGVGSVRASSFPIAVLGNTGAFGAVTYGMFLLRMLFARKHRWAEPFPAACQSAARWACFAQLVGASVAGSFIDLGLPFFIFAGLACAGPQTARFARTASARPALFPAEAA